jgi:hypothetical protein
MKDNLENFIEQNRDKFDDAEPSSGLWNSIESRMPEKSRVIKMRPFAYAASMAAVGLIVWIVATIVMKPDNNNAEKMMAWHEEKPILPVAEKTDTVKIPVYIGNAAIQANNTVNATPDKDIYAEITRYYDSEIAKRKTKLYSASSGNKEIMSQVQEEMAMIDTLNTQTRRELGNGINVGQVMEQLVQNYRQSIDILDMMLDQVNEEYAQINE